MEKEVWVNFGFPKAVALRLLDAMDAQLLSGRHSLKNCLLSTHSVLLLKGLETSHER